MKLIELQYGIDSLWSFKRNIILKKGKVYSSLKKRFANLDHYKRVYYSGEYIFAIINKNIEILNLDFQNIATLQVDDPVGISFLDGLSNYVIRCGKNEEEYLFYYNNIFVKRENNIIGRLLNGKFRLHFKDAFASPTYFRCSDLLDTITYWEYDCGEEYVASRFYVWNSKLVFSKSKGTDVRLVLIDLPTGKIDWEVKIIYGAFFFDDQSGVLASVWGSRKEGGKYQIIHLQKQLVEIGEIEEFNMEYVRVNWETQFLTRDKYYFTETVYTTANEKPSPVKFGCFDIETKKIDFLQEVPEAAGSQFTQVICHEEKLYLRTSGNELFVFEEE